MKLNYKYIITSFFVLVFHCLKAQSDNYKDDKSFVGKWQLEIHDGDSIYVRCQAIPSNKEGFELTLDDKTIKQKLNADNTVSIYTANWWSLSMGNFAIQYLDTIINKEIIERFIYKDTNQIIRVAYEEIASDINSVFLGYWMSNNPDGTTYIKVNQDTLPDNVNAFKLLPGGSGKIRREAGKQQVIVEFIWWLNDDGTYFDMQYSYPKPKNIVIEGFEIIQGTEPIQIRRTRLDQITD